MQGANWKIEFSWVKAHAGIHGNELANWQRKQHEMNTLMLLFAEFQSAHYIKEYNKNPYSAVKRNGKTVPRRQ